MSEQDEFARDENGDTILVATPHWPYCRALKKGEGLIANTPTAEPRTSSEYKRLEDFTLEDIFAEMEANDMTGFFSVDPAHSSVGGFDPAMCEMTIVVECSNPASRTIIVEHGVHMLSTARRAFNRAYRVWADKDWTPALRA